MMIARCLQTYHTQYGVPVVTKDGPFCTKIFETAPITVGLPCQIQKDVKLTKGRNAFTKKVLRPLTTIHLTWIV